MIQITAKILAFFVNFISVKDKEIVNLHGQLFLNKKNGAKFSRKVYEHFILVLLELIFLKNEEFNKEYTFEFSDEMTFNEMASTKKSKLILSAHIGNWELMAAAFAERGVIVTTVARRARSKLVQKFLERIRAKSRIKTVWRTERDSTKEIIRLVKNQELIAGLIDQDTRVGSTVSSFMGLPAKTPNALIAIGLRNDAKLFCCFNARVDKKKFYIEIKELKSTAEAEIIEEYNKNLESFIYRYPEQWVWFHKRWRSPDNETTFSHEAYVNYLKSKIKERNNQEKL
jgi:KDO2-lipid IV(A) lauroyltransferase